MQSNGIVKDYVLKQFPTREDVEVLSSPLLEYVLDDKHSALSKVTDHLYITSIGGITQKNFDKHKFHTVYDMSRVAFYAPSEKIEYLKFNIPDEEDSTISHVFDSFADKVHENALNEKKTLVHCYAGVSRSATLVIAYLMKHQKLNLKDAFNYLKERRSVVRPNNGFFKQLIEYELQIFQKSSVYMTIVDDESKRLKIEVPHFFSEHREMLEREFNLARRELLELEKTNR